MDSVLSLESTDGGKTFEVPESCIGNAKDARETIGILVKAEETRSRKRAKFNGMLNGNPPYNPTVLASKGQADRANFTLREAEGFMAAAKTPYYRLFFGPDRFIQLTLDYGDADPGLLAEWSGKIATRYQYALEDWDGLDMQMQLSQFQMVAHGNGPMVWEDTTDWRSKARLTGQLLLPDDASADIDEWDTVAIPRSFLPWQLWQKVKNEKAATAQKWNVPAVKRAIMNAAPEDIKTIYGQSWEHYEAEMRKGVTGYNAKSKRIFATDLFQKEFDGKISHFIVLQEDEGLPEGVKSDDPMAGFLFRKIGRFESWNQILCPFLFDVGPDGQTHSVKGAGPKIFDICSASDRLTMAALDGAMKNAGLILHAKDGNALQEAATTAMTGATLVGPKYEVVQQRYVTDLQSPLVAKRDLKSTLADNTGNYKQRVREENPEPTLGQAQLNATQQSVLGDADASRYGKYLDRFHRETFRRILAMGKKLYASRKDIAPVDIEDEPALTPSERTALKMYRGCVITDGIPEEILEFENFCRIRATRLVGNGSKQMELIIGEKMLGLVGMMNERGRNFTQRMYVSALSGETVADATFPSFDTPQIVDSHMSLAALENNFLKIPGSQVMVDPSQDNVTHFDSHLAFIGQTAQMVQNGQENPRTLLVLLEQAGPHMYEHLVAVQGDPTRKGQVQEMMKAWMGVTKMADQLAQQIAEADAAAEKSEPQQAPDPELISKLAKVHGELGLKAKKQQGEFILKAQKQAFTLDQKDKQTAHKMRLDNIEAAMSMSRQQEDRAAA